MIPVNFNQWKFGGPKWKVALLVGLLAFFVAATPTLAKWSDTIVLPGLARYNIFGLTNDLVDRTGGMLEDTKKLEGEVAKAEEALEGLKRQNQLLNEQIETNHLIKKELDNQLAGNVGARELMQEILKREKRTVKLIEQTAVRAEQVKEQMIDIVGQLGFVAENTGEVANTTAKMNQRMDTLLAELDTSVHNFRLLAKIKGGIETVKNILDETLKRTAGSILPSPEKSGKSSGGSAEESRKEKTAVPSPKETKQEEEKSGGGLLRRLLDPLLDPLLP